MASSAPYIAVMDADLQHDETILPEMLRRIEDEGLDVVVASRKITGGSMGDFAKNRVHLSNLGSRIASLICRCEVSDPMSGYFIVESGFFRELVPRLTGTGFKILMNSWHRAKHRRALPKYRIALPVANLAKANSTST